MLYRLAVLLVAALLYAGCATCCQCAKKCEGCPARPGMVCAGTCGDSCFYCPAGSDCSCDSQCLGQPQPLGAPAGGSKCQQVPRVGK